MSLQSWQRSLRSARDFARESAVARCDLCSAEIAPVHAHLVEPQTRRVICGCEGCAMLFDAGGATRYRRVPRSATWLVDLQLSDETWAALRIPISLGFVFRSSQAQAMVAAYPSPAGLTEASVEEAAWAKVEAASEQVASLREDVEALLVDRLRGRRDYLVAPIDRCFELAGIVRRYWRGVQGGDRVWEEVDRYLAQLKEGARR